MGKILIVELILYLLLLILMHCTQFVVLLFVFLGLYVISGLRRKYFIDLEIDYAIGFTQNIAALLAGFFSLIYLTYTVWTNSNFVSYAYFMAPIPVVQFFGTKRYLLRLFVSLLFLLIWCVGMILLFSPPEFTFSLNDCFYFGFLLLGVRVFEVLFDSYFQNRKSRGV